MNHQAKKGESAPDCEHPSACWWRDEDNGVTCLWCQDREHLLDQIRRLVEENEALGGKAGKKRRKGGLDSG